MTGGLAAAACGLGVGHAISYTAGSLTSGRFLGPGECFCGDREGAECLAYAGTGAILDVGVDSLTNVIANKFRSLPDLDNGSGNTRSLRSGWDEFGNPCTKLASTGGSGAGADGFLTTLASVFLPVEASACDVGNYSPPPKKDITNKLGLEKIKPKGKRATWRDSNKNIYEWDYQHGMFEVYDKKGRHQGEMDLNGDINRNKADKTRKPQS